MSVNNHRHFVKICEFDRDHGGCKCISNGREVIDVPCDRPLEHKPKNESPTVLESPSILSWLDEAAEDNRLLTAPSLRDRLLRVAQDNLGELLLPGPINHLVSEMNEAVAEHLRLEADKLER